jgi:hypothetical protein
MIEKHRKTLGDRKMESISDASSDGELLGLRNEGKITEDEYNSLLNAMRTCPADKGMHTDFTGKPKSKSKTGKIAFLLILAGIILPFSCFFIIEALAPPNTGAAIGPWFFLGLALEITALTMGIKSWSNDYGKTATIASGIIIILAILLIS